MTIQNKESKKCQHRIKTSIKNEGEIKLYQTKAKSAEKPQKCKYWGKFTNSQTV